MGINVIYVAQSWQTNHGKWCRCRARAGGKWCWSSFAANISYSDKGPLPADLIAELRTHRWDRKPTHWSD